ncbi:MAG: hypothetical protein K2O10_06090, partial [Muribaculaceae bacterium]|nr:hypothetical protein [Muribaculaceae bacterium]
LLLGHAYMGLARYEDASKAYFKAEYLGAKPEKVLRNLAWSLLMRRDFTRARDYYEKAIIATGALDVDFLNIGHIDWAEGHYQDALVSYRRNIEGRAKSAGVSLTEAAEQFIADIRSDSADMQSIGIDVSLIPMVIDTILYSLE